MKWHNRRFNPETGQKQDKQQDDTTVAHLLRYNPPRLEINRTTELVGQCQGKKQGRPSGKQVDQILPPCGYCLRRLFMDDQRIGGNGQYLIKYDQCQQVGSKGNTYGSEKTNGKAGKVARLLVF